MKRFSAILLSALLTVPSMLTVFPETAVYAEELTHQCGENLFWELEDGGETLHISGTGKLDIYAGYSDNNQAFPARSLRHEIRKVIIDEGCTEIANGTFRNKNKDWELLESVSIPESVQVIGASAFESCYELWDVTLPPALKEIGRYAFSMTSLTEVTIPEGITELPDHCFTGQTLERVQLPSHLVSIGDACFSGCPLLEMNMPDTIRYIGYNALPTDSEWFGQYLDLDYVVFGTVLYRVKENNTGSYEIPDGVTLITEKAFAKEEDSHVQIPITSLTIPDSVTDIQGFPFPDYYRFTETSGNCVILGNGLLYQYTGRERVVQIPEGVRYICERAFENNETIISVHCPDSLRRIGDRAFSLSAVQQVILNDGLESIGEKAFERCSYLKEMYIPESVTEIGNLMIDEASTFTKIIGEPGSEAEAFANRNRNPFQAYEAPFSVGYDMTPVYGEDNWAISNGSDYFGSTYFMKDEIRALLRDELQIVTDEDLDEPFVGSCYGLSLTMLFAKAGLISPAVIQPGAKHLHDLQATEDVLSVINYYHFLMHSDSHLLNDTIAMTPERKLLKMIEIAENVKNGQIPFLLTFSFKSGRHAMLGYGIESGKWEWNGSDYNGRILIWDPNSPNALHEGSCLYYDTETLNFCIPYYNVYYEGNRATATGNIDSFTNDLSSLNYHPYPFAAVVGDLNGSGTADISDAVLLCKTLSEDQQGSSVNWDAADLDGDGILTLLDLRFLLHEILIV